MIEKYDTDVVNAELEKQSDFMDELTKNIKAVPRVEEKKEEAEPDHLSAEITVLPYDYEMGSYQVKIQNIVCDDNIHTVRCAVWKEEDQSDLIWYEAEQQEDGTYLVTCKARDFKYEPGDYLIHVYGVTDDGDPELLGNSVGTITE